MKNPKEGAEGAGDPTIVVVKPTEPTQEGATAEAAGTVVAPAGVGDQQEIERLQREAMELLGKKGGALIDQVKNLMEERDGLLQNKGKLLLTVEELKREASGHADRADQLARENAELLGLADELKSKNVALEKENADLLTAHEQLMAETDYSEYEKGEAAKEVADLTSRNLCLKKNLSNALRTVVRLKAAYSNEMLKNNYLAADVDRAKADFKLGCEVLGRERIFTRQVEDEVSRLLL